MLDAGAMLGLVPAGLDGHSKPLVSAERTRLLRLIAAKVTARDRARTVLVGIDGASGTGKSTFGDELAQMLTAAGDKVVRASIDSFHRPSAERYRRGKASPEGYYLDSHALGAVRSELLDPFRSGSGVFRRALFDEASDSFVDESPEPVPAGGVLIIDGLFLHRGELVGCWDISVFLVADRRREQAWLEYLSRGLPTDPAERAAEVERRRGRARHQRYVEGQAMYERDASPRERADLVIDNDDLAAPTILVDRL